MGTPVETWLCMLQIRQHGRGGSPQESHSEGPPTDAPTALFSILRSILQVLFCSETCVRGAKHCSRCDFSQQYLTFPLSCPADISHGHPTSSARLTRHQETQLGLQQLDDRIHILVNRGIADNTRAVYQSGWRQYTKFCGKFGLSTLPLTEYTLCQFATTLSESVSWGTIRSYLSALRFFQISAGLSDPVRSRALSIGHYGGLQRGPTSIDRAT